MKIADVFFFPAGAASSAHGQAAAQAPATAVAVPLPVLRHGELSSALQDLPQKVMFVKSDTKDAKSAITNVVLSEQGIQLITMGLAPGLMWNTYMNDTVLKAAKIGKGMILKRSDDPKGFEFDRLPGLTARTTFKPGKSAPPVTPGPPPTTGGAGFLAWDFRVIE